MRYAAVCMFIMNVFLSYSQDERITLYALPAKGRDSSYLRDYSNFFVPCVYTIRHFSTFHIRDNYLKKQIDYSPNIVLGVGLCASYKWMAIAGSTGFRFLNNDEYLYGKTKRLDFYTNLYSTKFLYDLNFQYYKGYYIASPEIVDSTWKKGMPYPYRPDIGTGTAGFAVYYISNYKKFSLKAPYNYCDEQLRSAGSWIAGGFTSFYTMIADGDSSVVPANSHFNDSSRVKALLSFDIGIAGGYAYTQVIKKNWFISGMFLPGLSRQIYYGFNPYIGLMHSRGITLKSQTRIAIGYSRPRFYMGWVIVFDVFNLNSSKSSTFKYKSGYTCLSVGTRLLTPAQKKKIKTHYE